MLLDLLYGLEVRVEREDGLVVVVGGGSDQCVRDGQGKPLVAQRILPATCLFKDAARHYQVAIFRSRTIRPTLRRK